MQSLFEKVDLPQYPTMLDDLGALVNWIDYDQICINSIPGKTDDHQLGNGSLTHNWDESENVWDENHNSYIWIVPLYDNPMQESDFTEICDIFKGTVFDDMMTMLQAQYAVGRVRVMKSLPKTCLSWHKDNNKRLHYPIKTHEGCKMIINDEVKNLPLHEWWITNTLHFHTAINAGKEPRLHIVATLL